MGMMFGAMRLDQRMKHMRHEKIKDEKKIETTIQESTDGSLLVKQRTKERQLDSQIRLRKRLRNRMSSSGTIKINQEEDVILSKAKKLQKIRSRKGRPVLKKINLTMKERDQLMQILMEQGAGKSMKETEFDALLATKQGHELVEHLRLIDQAVKYKKARRRTLSRINIDPNELEKEMEEEENGEQEDTENESSSLLLLQKKARMLLFKIPKGKKKRKGGKGKGKGGSGKVIEKEMDTNQ